MSSLTWLEPFMFSRLVSRILISSIPSQVLHPGSSSLKCTAVGITQVQHKLGVRQQGSIGVHIRHAELQSGLGSSADGGIESQKSADGQCRRHGGGGCILLSSGGGGMHHMLMTSSVESMQLLDQDTA